jgi:hypothetical protein
VCDDEDARERERRCAIRFIVWVYGCVGVLDLCGSLVCMCALTCRGLRCWVVVVVCGGRGGADVRMCWIVDDRTLQLYQFDCCASAPHKKNAVNGGAWLEECGRW